MIKVFAIFICLFLAVALVHAEGTATGSVIQKYGVTFPISELGSCNSVTECYSYCANPANRDACVAFARKKGFYKISIFEAAKQVLGCDSESSCKEVCGLQANWEKCGEFAKKYRLSGGRVESLPDKAAMLEKAKEYLGCNSYDSCKALCNEPSNQQKCQELSRMVTSATPLPAGRENCRNLTEKMGSASSEGIKAYYLKNCAPPDYHPATSTGVPIAKEEYCRMYPDRCAYLTPSPKPTYDLETKCRSYPSCTFSDGVCRCGSQEGEAPSSSVKGISSIQGILQQFQIWLGF